MTKWEPLLSGELLERAEEALAEITGSLSTGPPPAARSDWSPEATRTSAACLANGYPGQALYFAYLHQSGGEERFVGIGLEILDRAIEVASSENMTPALFEGFTGLTWTTDHLAETERCMTLPWSPTEACEPPTIRRPQLGGRHRWRAFLPARSAQNLRTCFAESVGANRTSFNPYR